MNSKRSEEEAIVVVDRPLHQSPAKEPQAAKKKTESTRVAGDLLATAWEAVAGVAFDPPFVLGSDTEDGVAEAGLAGTSVVAGEGVGDFAPAAIYKHAIATS